MVFVSNLVAGLEKGLDDPQKLLDGVFAFSGKVGIELFIHTFSMSYMERLRSASSWLEKLPRTTHGPFIGVEGSSEQGSEQQRQLMLAYRSAFAEAVRLGSGHLVFHSNERHINCNEKMELQVNCLVNLMELLKMADQSGITLLIENLGLPTHGVPLFDEDEYINLFDRFPDSGCLIDVGHLSLAGWDLERVISRLKKRITGYHLHNNDGVSDSHCRIGEGTIDYNEFFSLYRRYTPRADITLEYGDNHGITAADLIEDLNRVISSAEC